jgi:hypothetical protein
MHASHRCDDRIKEEDKRPESALEKTNGLAVFWILCRITIGIKSK